MQLLEDGLATRPLTAADQAVLWDLLHVALWDPPPAGPRPREILDRPDVRIYADAWGRDSDVGVALVDARGVVAGAAWMRLLTAADEPRGLAYCDDETPQLGIALFRDWQHRGLGEPMLREALAAAWRRGYPRVALTVHPENPAIALYVRCGFVDRGTRGTYRLMVATRDP